MSSGKTNQMLGRLPLVLGMPVYCLHNFDVAHGIANGTRGILRRIRYKLNDKNERILTSCIIQTDTSADILPWLQMKEVPILSSSNSFTITHHYDNTKLTFN